MPLCRECRQSYTFRGLPSALSDSRKWSANDRLCTFCLERNVKLEKRVKRERQRGREGRVTRTHKFPETTRVVPMERAMRAGLRRVQ